MFLLYKVTSVYGSENIAGQSAILSDTNNQTPYQKDLSNLSVYDYNLKRNAILKVLNTYNSPLAKSVDSFIETCTRLELDCYLLPAITGLESTFGIYIHPGSYNPFGWGGGYINFESWDEAIEAVGSGLKNNYIARGAVSVEQIGRIYAASPTWAYRIQNFMGEFEKAENTGKLEYSGLEIKL